MDIFGGLEQIVERDCSVREHTWFGLGGKADYLIAPQDVGQLSMVVRRCVENGVAMYVLGGGSNLLVRDEGIRGAVIKLAGPGFEQTSFEAETVKAGAGVDLNKLVLECVRRGLSGLEALTGIPGCVGGAVKMNAGGNFGDIGTVVEGVTLMDNHGNVFEKHKPELVFDYRQTNIAARFILGAEIKLVAAEPEQIMRAIKEVWIYKKNSQPLNTRSAGCIFKNPRGLSAGALVDRAGLKGLRIGGAVVSEKHANFIVAEKDCTSSDVIRLIEAVRERVKKQFDVELELEIEIWP
jgi:UDP-N-acetylmuramate dehydrogenase